MILWVSHLHGKIGIWFTQSASEILVHPVNTRYLGSSNQKRILCHNKHHKSFHNWEQLQYEK